MTVRWIITLSLLYGMSVSAQPLRYRGAPDPLEVDTLVGADPRGHDRGVIMAPVLIPVVAAENGAVPAGIEPLPIDIFTTTDFYADSALWDDPRYFRCNSPSALESLGGATRLSMMGDDPPRTTADTDLPVIADRGVSALLRAAGLAFDAQSASMAGNLLLAGRIHASHIAVRRR